MELKITQTGILALCQHHKKTTIITFNHISKSNLYKYNEPINAELKDKQEAVKGIQS